MSDNSATNPYEVAFNNLRSTSYISTYQERLASYRNGWPHAKPSDRLMAAAGFYYIGFSDAVICRYCRLGLLDWKEYDSPYHEHSNYSPNCPYV